MKGTPNEFSAAYLPIPFLAELTVSERGSGGPSLRGAAGNEAI
jgi:hypothetical protein